MNDSVSLIKRTTKRPRSSSELDALARVFVEDWMEGEHVLTWLVRHEGEAGELSRLIRMGWTWSDLSLAMARAGISYRPGTPINPRTLRQRAYDVRVRVRAREGRETAARVAVADQARQANAKAFVPVSSSPQPEPPSGSEGPMFRPVRFLNPPSREPAPRPIYPPLPRPEPVDADTAIARMLGRPPPKTEE